MAINLRGRTASSDPPGSGSISQRNKVAARKARYIKLGPSGAWERKSIDEGVLLFGYQSVPHDIALGGDTDALTRVFRDQGAEKGAARRHAIQVMDFYTLGEDTIWITFADGYLWWCVAAPGVGDLGHDDEQADREGSRLRRTVGGWHNESIGGKKLYMNELNGGLVQTQRFQGTVCDVKEFDYLLRKINDEELPVIVRGKEARGRACQSIEELMTLLTWRDFEILVDLVFSASGWRRIGESGGTQKTVDIELELPTTGERAFVQVKSRTNQIQLDDYLERFAGRDEARMFYVYHSSKGELHTDNSDVSLIGPERLSFMVLDAGLFDWLLRKVG